MKRFIPIFVLCIVACSCQTDFSVWRDVNADVMTTVQCDTAYKSTPSGVLYKVVYPVYHKGYVPKPDSYVLVNYKGMLIDGTVFEVRDSAPLQVSELIVGLQEMLCLDTKEEDGDRMTDGMKVHFYVPYDLGYGADGLKLANGNFAIPPYSTLIFDLELLMVVNN